MPRKTFTAGDVLTASDMNTFLMNQAVQTYADSTARDSAVSTATAPAGLVTYLEDTDAFEYWNGAAYEPFGPPAPPTPVTFTTNFLVVAGGGGGGGVSAGNSGGGGAGGFRTSSGNSGGNSTAENSITLKTGQTYEVTVGAGGAAGTTGFGPKGNNSSFEFLTAVGGGGGGRFGDALGGQVGGSGGGEPQTFAGIDSGEGAGTTYPTDPIVQGFRGGLSANQVSGGGGGGTGAVGGNASTNGGVGGVGISSSITGSAVFRAGGGGGSTHGSGSGAAAGGNGGGGTGKAANGTVGTSGTVNTGGGGGGGGENVSGSAGAGGSGIVILRYPDTRTITIGAGLTGTTATAGGFSVTQITDGTGNVSWA